MPLSTFTVERDAVRIVVHTCGQGPRVVMMPSLGRGAPDFFVIAERLAAAGMEPLPGTPAEFTAYLRREVTKWRGIVKQTGVTPQ